MWKPVLSAAAVALTFIIFVPYIRSIISGRTRPHVISWVIWATGTLMVFGAQLADGGGVGAWPIGVSGLITAGIAVLAFRVKADRRITRTDWITLGAALSAMPCWLLTADPLWAVIILTAVDLAGFVPTFRASWHHPHDENLLFYALAAMRNTLVILALENHSVTTVLFPAAVGLACMAFVLMVRLRRRPAPSRA